jgi:hypothetical protein
MARIHDGEQVLEAAWSLPTLVVTFKIVSILQWGTP